jgi:KUP system potassium uptake protein
MSEATVSPSEATAVPAHPTIEPAEGESGAAEGEQHAHHGVVALTLGALGVVFGDVGTSPLYTLQECLGPNGVPPNSGNVYGVLSLFFWLLTLIVTIKYAIVLMRADNRGEGGVMALLSMIPGEQRSVHANRASWIVLAVLAAAGLLFADGVITPAISLLSATEGLKLVNPKLSSAVVPLSVGLLLALFALQRRGTGGIGKLFGPVMLVWFITIAAIGGMQIWKNPAVLGALSPHHAVRFLLEHGWAGFPLLGSAVLCVTGGEALYADMGHFGRFPIRLAWGALVFPALVLCYFGQGALLLTNPDAAAAPFFSQLSSPGARIALVLLATTASIIASQGLISASFSLTHQSIRLGYFPRVMVQHTSDKVAGQIYVPAVNWVLALSCLALVLVYQQSTRLAAGFGLAVSGTMAVTSLVLYPALRSAWRWPRWKAAGLVLLFLAFDLPLFFASCLKFQDGGYIPFLIAAAFYGTMIVWTTGRSVLRQQKNLRQISLPEFIARLKAQPPVRTPSLGIYLNSNPDVTPPVVLTQLERFGGVPEQVLFLTVTSENVPYVEQSERLRITDLGEGCYQVLVVTGFMEIPALPEVVATATSRLPLRYSLDDATFFLGRETLLDAGPGKLPEWQRRLYAFMARNSTDITRYFELPANQVVEVGSPFRL